MTAPATAPVTREGRAVLRLVPPVILWWVWVAFVAANVADFAIQGVSSARFGAVVSAVLLLITGLMYTLALRPRVIADGTGLTVVNPFRVHRLPWPLIQTVDAGEWVRVHYAADGSGPAPGWVRSSAGAKTVHCWALYVSAGARRKATRRVAARRRGGLLTGTYAWHNPEAIVGTPGGGAKSSSRMPAEARYLASLPPAVAMATQLDTRAARERAAQPAHPARPAQADTAAAADTADTAATADAAAVAASADSAPGTPANAATAPVTATAAWSWPALAAVVLPALILLIAVFA